MPFKDLKSERKYWKVYRKKNRKRINANHRDYYRRMRQKALDHYGGKCACCGTRIFEFLAFDHIKGGGLAHLRRYKIKQSFFYWLQSRKYPKGFRVLCHNCNMAIGHYGYCPHQLRKRK